MKFKVNVPLKQHLSENPTLQSLKRALEIEAAYKQRVIQQIKKGAH